MVLLQYYLVENLKGKAQFIKHFYQFKENILQCVI